jgi:hypothetical protein
MSRYCYIVGGTRNVILQCLYPKNMEICEGYKFSIPGSIWSVLVESNESSMRGGTNIVVDHSLLQMFKETDAEQDTFDRLTVNWANLDKCEIEKSDFLGSILVP